MAYTRYERKPEGDEEEFATLEKLCDMIEYAYPLLEQYPKRVRFTFAAKIENIMLDALRYCVKVGKKKAKKTALYDLDIEIAALKRFIRLSFKLKYISPHQFEVWSGKVVEIGKMIGGMIKAENQEPHKS
jgi:hypothetical protein